MNRRFCEMVGYSRDELLQMKFSDIAVPEDRELDTTAFRNLVEGRGGPYRIEKRCVRKDGSVFWAAVTRSMQSGCEHGRCCISIVEDISKRKEVERQFHFFKYLIEKSQDPFYVVSPAEDFRFVYVNPAACRHFGRSERELLSMHVLEWDPMFTPESLRDLWEGMREEKSGLFETVHLHASGRRIPVELSANYFVYEGQELSAGYFQDISQRKAAEEALEGKRTALPNARRQHPPACLDGRQPGLHLLVQPALVRLHGNDIRGDGGLGAGRRCITRTMCERVVEKVGAILRRRRSLGRHVPDAAQGRRVPLVPHPRGPDPR